MTSRRVSWRIGQLVLVTALAGCARDLPESDASLLLFTLDTTRADRLEPYGAADAETPNLLSMAREGVVLEHAYAVTPVTLPSHVSLFTGLDPTRHGVHNNGVALAAGRHPLLAEILRREGLRTAAFVSAAVLDHRFGLASGFESYDDDLASAAPRGARLIAERPAAATVDAAAAWLDGLAAGQRFFLWVHLFEPHAAYHPPPPFAERFRDHPYDGEIAAMDLEIGRLLRHPRVSRAPVVVMAIGDHGESLGEHGEETHAMLAYDATLRIPWIVRLPVGGRGSRLRQPVSQVDLLPTALDLLAVEPPPGLDLAGISLAPALTEGVEPAAERAIYAESLVAYLTYGWAPLRSLRRGSWKLIRGSGTELFDLEADPGELHNVAEKEPERLRGLVREMSDLVVRAEPTADGSPSDRETAEKLRSLGYLSGSGAGARRRRRPDPKEMIGAHLGFERAAHFFYRRELERAIPELRAVLELDGENLAALTMLARALAERMKQDEALSLARRAVALAPEDAEARITLGVVEARRGSTEAALATLTEALQLQPDSLDARLEIALLLFRLDRPAEGETALREVLSKDEQNSRALIAMAERVELAAGQLDSAERRLREVLARDPSRVEGWRVLGRVLERADRPQEAMATFRRGLAEVPGDGALQAQLGMALARLGRLNEAEASLRRANELMHPGSPGLHNALARLLMRRGEWRQAEREARRAVELDPRAASAWNNLGAAREELGDPQGALAAYERSLASDAGYWHAEFNRALLLRQLGRYQEAAAGYRAVLQKVPGHAKSHFELGLLYLGPLGDSAAARRHLIAVIKAEPGSERSAEARRLLARMGASP